MPYGMSADEMVEQIREQDENWAKVAHALGNFLAAAFPHASAQVHDLTRAIQQLMQTGSERQMRALKTPPPAYKPPVELLARIVADRDRLVEVLEKLEKGIESGPQEMREFFEATAVTGSSPVGTGGGAIVEHAEVDGGGVGHRL